MNILLLIAKVINLFPNLIYFSLGFEQITIVRTHRKSRALISPLSNPLKKCNTIVFIGSIRQEARKKTLKPLYSSNQYEDSDSNKWTSSDDSFNGEQEDWEKTLEKRGNDSFWSSFESSEEDGDTSTAKTTIEDYDDGENFLDAIASIGADEVDFMNTEADRADKVRQMQEWGFNGESIAATLGVATDESLETDEENEVFEKFKEETAKTGFGMYLEDDYDIETVESHANVEIEEETGEPVRAQMVYVDEHACIGCYNCATTAQSTFFMEAEHGRARVFSQWGDDDETVQIAIETCPVDCIYYVPYDELVRLEVERRDQNINFKARLVNQGEYGGDAQHKAGGNGFTAPQRISGNMGARCNNCPTRGCKDCPMYGVGKNPSFERKERQRKERETRRRIKQQRENSERSTEL